MKGLLHRQLEVGDGAVDGVVLAALRVGVGVDPADEGLARGLDAARLDAPDDFRRWPVIGREVLLADRARLRSQAPGLRLLSKSTIEREELTGPLENRVARIEARLRAVA